MLEKILEKYELVMGLEVHAQLKTNTKLMSGAGIATSNIPNTLVSTICTGFPGALPVLNARAVEMGIKAALAFHCQIQPLSIFSRKHYFYPDLPKGYQISQYDRPYALGGAVEFYLEGQKKSIGLTRIHLEEDAGKNLHFDERGISLIDLNRSSVPLIEIVSEPQLRSPAEAAAYLKALRLALRYLEICDGNLEEGNLRCDANVSLRPKGQKAFGTRVELKNINSYRNLEKAIVFEAVRQFDLIENGESIVQETRLWDANQSKSISMRSKEEASDYRYMPEPDLLPLHIDGKEITAQKSKLPELPIEKLERFMKQYERSSYDAEVLTASRDLADYYETVAVAIKDFHLASNFIQSTVLSHIPDHENQIAKLYPDANALSELLLRVKDGTLSLGMAKEVFELMIQNRKSSTDIIRDQGLSQVTDESALLDVVNRVLKENPDKVKAYQEGKTKLFGFFMGQCQKELGGKANPQALKALLEQKIGST